MIVKFHHHGGFYGDGNSHYWWTDKLLDVEKNTLKIHTEDSYYGQLSSNGNFNEVVKDDERPAVPFSQEEENQIYDVLLPLIEVAGKYPHLESFRFFSQKHKFFITGRIRKACRIGRDSNSDYYGVENLHHVFVLKSRGIILNVYFEDTFKHSFFKVKVSEI